MFDGFRLDQITVDEVTLRVRYGGSGSPVVLLHVIPVPTRPGTLWHRGWPNIGSW
jgi:haloacetate dehalogenase